MLYGAFAKRSSAMEHEQLGMDRAYFAQRAAEEQELAQAARDNDAADAHRKLQRAYLERASIGGRPTEISEEIG
jgi:hypothetical protein